MLWGKFIGFMIGLSWGPLGAIAGIFFGHMFDKGLKNAMNPSHYNEEVQQAFFATTFQVMGHIAKADGRVSEEEIKVATKIMRERFQLDESQLRLAMECFNFGKSEEFDLNIAMNHLVLECKGSKNLIIFFIEIQLKMALADGEINIKEQEILLFICQKLGIDQAGFDFIFRSQAAGEKFHKWQKSQRQSSNNKQQWVPSKQDELEAAYNVLGVSKSSSDGEIKKAYRRLMSQHHPDKLVAKGLPSEMVEVAKEKSQEIIAAYELVWKSRKGY